MVAVAVAVAAVAAMVAAHCWLGLACCPAVARVFVSFVRRCVDCWDQGDAGCSTLRSIRSSEARSLPVPDERNQLQVEVVRSQHEQLHALCQGS